MNESFETLMQAATDVARVAGDLALRHFGDVLAPEAKHDGSPVTIADREAERAAREWIESRYPGDGVVGEEFGESRPGAARRWFIDPVDGTRTFVRGVPMWATLIGVVEVDRVIAGAAYFPALRETAAAGEGCGAWWNGSRCKVSAVSNLSEAALLTTDARFPRAPSRRVAWERLADLAGVSRTWGDAYGYLLVATGRAEAMTDPQLQPWDAAPFQVLIEEAGGVFTDWRGRPTVFGGDAIATNLALADLVRAALAPRP
ncbi:MAG: histidinol phosphate phosphatase [Candidatus Eisenbacteria bacterium]|nr:histidinol phosphate phosphatase [Candidatus Eisenbacteria bacterium]